jgi:hypothetical protein
VKRLVEYKYALLFADSIRVGLSRNPIPYEEWSSDDMQRIIWVVRRRLNSKNATLSRA